MISNFFGTSGSTPSTSATNYINICGESSYGSTEPLRTQVSGCAFTLQNFYIQINNAPGTGKSYTFTVRKNAVDTAITCTISDAATTGSDAVHTVSVAAGDRLSISVTPSGTPTAPTYANWTSQADSGGTHFAPILAAAGGTSGLSASVDSFAPFTLSTSGTPWNATEANQSIIAPTSGTIDQLYLKTDTAPAAGKSFALTLVKNGTATALTATVSGTNTTANDTSNSVSISAGDTLSIKATPSGTPTLGRYS